jgi:hypothetical protein
MSLERHQLLHGGFVPLPLAGKRPIFNNWQFSEPSHGEVALWPRGNTGILNRNAPAVDIDILDVDVANQIEALVVELAGPTLVRTGLAPKRALLYRTEVPFAKMRTPHFPLGHVEVLCDGQQIVCFGVHPDTGRPYEWHPHPPTKRSDLPVLDAAVAREIISRAKGIMEGAGWVPVQRERRDHPRAPSKNTALVSSKNTALVSPRRIRATLEIVEQAEISNRTPALFWAACRFGELGLSEALAESLLISAAQVAGLIQDYGIERVRRQILNGMKVGRLEGARWGGQ